jgi:hypothetical protein
LVEYANSITRQELGEVVVCRREAQVARLVHCDSQIPGITDDIYAGLGLTLELRDDSLE